MPEYDAYGFCCLCHRNLRYEQVINNQVMMRFSADYDETEYLLNDGSKMRIAICKLCKAELTEEHNKKIMDNVKAGWKEEVKVLPWTEEKKKDYIARYMQKDIVCLSDRVPMDILKEKHLDYQRSKNGIDCKALHI